MLPTKTNERRRSQKLNIFALVGFLKMAETKNISGDNFNIRLQIELMLDLQKKQFCVTYLSSRRRKAFHQRKYVLLR